MVYRPLASRVDGPLSAPNIGTRLEGVGRGADERTMTYREAAILYLLRVSVEVEGTSEDSERYIRTRHGGNVEEYLRSALPERRDVWKPWFRDFLNVIESELEE